MSKKAKKKNRFSIDGKNGEKSLFNLYLLCVWHKMEMNIGNDENT